MQIADQTGKGDDAIVTVIAIFNDRGYQPLLRGVAQYLTHHHFIRRGFAGQIAHPPGFIAKQRRGFLPDGVLFRGKSGFVIRQM
ncbi:hypothetical protein D3C81_2156480 [compost metagenome]